MNETVQKTMDGLRKNQMKPYFVETKEEVVPLVDSLVPAGSLVAVGGSMSLFEAGVITHLRSGKYDFLDRYQEQLSREEIEEIYRKTFSADVFFTSTNAVTEQGELYNVDGNGNRVAALTYGPKSVIVVAGINKIVPDLEAAVYRVKTIAAPKNCVRLHCDTYCKQEGKCVSLLKDHPEMTEGCESDSRICRHYQFTARQRQKDRIQVILVGQELGY